MKRQVVSVTALALLLATLTVDPAFSQSPVKDEGANLVNPAVVKVKSEGGSRYVLMSNMKLPPEKEQNLYVQKASKSKLYCSAKVDEVKPGMSVNVSFFDKPAKSTDEAMQGNVKIKGMDHSEDDKKEWNQFEWNLRLKHDCTYEINKVDINDSDEKK